MPPHQSLIWAVLRKSDSEKRLVWSLCATFLGVMCLSGDVHDLDAAQWAIVERGVAFYRSVSHLIQRGVTSRFGPSVDSYRHPNGWQAVVRASPDGDEKLLVVHVFSADCEALRLEMCNGYAIQASFSVAAEKIKQCDGAIQIQAECDEAFALLLRRDNT
jgi:alpha-galactosidase